MKVYLQSVARTGGRLLAFSEEVAPRTLSVRGERTLAGVRGEDEFFEEDLKFVLEGYFSELPAGEEVTIDLDTPFFSRSYFCNAVLDALHELDPAPQERIFLLSRRDPEWEVPEEVSQAVLRPQKTDKNTSFSEEGDLLRSEVERYLEEKPMPSFRQYLSALIEAKGIAKDSAVYRAAGISKFTFSKIMNFKLCYKPSKPTVAALALGLRLTAKEAQELFHAAGYHLGRAEISDRIICFCLERQVYDLDEVNDCLFYYGIPLLGERTREEVRLSR